MESLKTVKLYDDLKEVFDDDAAYFIPLLYPLGPSIIGNAPTKVEEEYQRKLRPWEKSDNS